MTRLLNKIKKNELPGRGGACFPVYRKWESILRAKAEHKYIICNASEGEPDVFKDGYILEHYPERVIEGIKLAMDELKATKAYIFINEKYHKKYSKRLEYLAGEVDIEIFKKPHSGGYIAGEESAQINAIEGDLIEPTAKPPYPAEKGLFGYPTLVNNVETFYDISLIDSGEYKKRRFYSLTGDCMWPGVFQYPDDMPVKKVLEKSNNWPDFYFFVQIGGGASGKVLNQTQLSSPVGGSGSVTVYSKTKHKPLELIKKWLDFFMKESCGQCTPCREGTYRLHKIINSPKPNWRMFFDILDDLPETSLCPLGASVPVPIISYFENVLKDHDQFRDIYKKYKNNAK